MHALRRTSILRSHITQTPHSLLINTVSPMTVRPVISNAVSFSSHAKLKDNDVVICSAFRSPIGNINGSLASINGPHLAAQVLNQTILKSKINPSEIDEIIIGNVVSSNIGQAPATQISILSNLPQSIPSTTINKVCASGMKAIINCAQSIELNQNKLCIAGGFESMSNVPYYLPKMRYGQQLGHGEVVDGIIKDGLWDSFNNIHMGQCAEQCAVKYNITREAQDNYCIESYRRAVDAQKNGFFKNEIVEINISTKKGDLIVKDDEEPPRLQLSKVRQLKSAFLKGGSVTAANASKLNDGAAFLVLASYKYAISNGLPILAVIRGYADAQKEPKEFTTAPAEAIPKALKRAGLTKEQVDYYEINEAFSVVALANMQLLGIRPEKINLFGGAVALGHPLGCSGARIVVTLLNVLRTQNGKIGVAAVCNGGGGASAMVVELL